MARRRQRTPREERLRYMSGWAFRNYDNDSQLDALRKWFDDGIVSPELSERDTGMILRGMAAGLVPKADPGKTSQG